MAREVMTSGTAHGHAGEILQGAIERDGEVRRILVSLPAPGLKSKAVFHPRRKGGLRVFPVWKRKSLRAAALALQTLGRSEESGVIELSDEIPVGRGLGSSTSDCVAAIRAVAAHFRAVCAPDTIARIAQQAEGSSDGTMFDHRVVAFLHCEGAVLEELGAALPKMRMLVVEPDGEARCVRTDELQRPRYSARQIDLFQRLRTRLRTALDAGDAAAIGAVASASAAINQSFLPKSHFDAVTQIGTQTQALGVAAAHSGTVLMMLYRESSHLQIAEARTMLAARGLEDIRELCTWSDAVE
jgi:uncharacterized protein involved in propanediol utilization